MLKQIALLCILCALMKADSSNIPLPQKPDEFENAAGCYVKELDTIIALGSTIASKDYCMNYTCEENSIALTKCPAVKKNSSVVVCEQIKGDPGKPYPDCCDKSECKVPPHIQAFIG